MQAIPTPPTPAAPPSPIRRLAARLMPLTAALIAVLSVGCAAERQPVATVPTQYSYVAEGRVLPSASTLPTTADRFLNATLDRPASSLGATAAADSFE